MDTTIPGPIAQYMPLLKSVGIAILIFVVGWIASKWTAGLIRNIFDRRKLDPSLGGFVAAIGQYTVLVAALIASLGAVGIQTTSLVAVFASAGLAVGLALQGSLANFSSGVMILFFRPFSVGDKIDVAGKVGDVEDIGLFATTMMTLDHNKIIVPNSAITSGVITNITTMGDIRGEIAVGVAYGTDLVKAMEVMKKASERCAHTLESPGAEVACTGLGASSVDFAVRGWCRAANYLAMLHELNVNVYDDLNAAGIEIPFSQLVLHHQNPPPASE